MAKKAKKTAAPVLKDTCTGANCVHVIKGSKHVDFNKLTLFEVVAISVVTYLSVTLGVILTLPLA